MRLVTETTLVTLFATLVGCSTPDNTRQETATKELTTSSTAAAPVPSVNSASGPIGVLADPSARGAKLEVVAGKAIVRLPPGMLQLLSDSLPGFAPFPISSYDPMVWASEVERDSSAVLPSVVIADFDGDGQADVAMVGLSHDSTAEIMLVTDATGKTGTHLLFMNRPRSAIGSAKADVLLRKVHQEVMSQQFKVRKAAVEEVDIGKGSVVFYVDGGVLRQIQTGG